MNKFLKGSLHALIAASISLPVAPLAYSQVVTPESNLCRDEGVVFIFFNGVQNTPDQADASLAELRLIHGDSTSNGESIRYEKFYNYSNGFEDFVEVFEQRLLEQEGLLQGRFELFFEAIRGGGNWWQRIVASVDSLGDVLAGLIDYFQAEIVESLATLAANPPTITNYAEHQGRIDGLIVENKKLMMVAHSQGNLFANSAFTYAVQNYGDDSGPVGLVHVAPASPTLNGSHTLADKDLVINGLRLVGSVPDVTHTIPAPGDRPPGVNGQTDVLGHGLAEIYLNPGLGQLSTTVKSQIDSTLNGLVAASGSGSTTNSGVFTVTLTWNGSGDVDLHTFEPDGRQVFYAAPTGNSGFLDTDNTAGFGPEHYYATCDGNALQSGTYSVRLANFSGAAGRIATVQIASFKDGVLGTRSFTMGNATGNVPNISAFDVVVNREPDSNSVNIRVQ